MNSHGESGKATPFSEHKNQLRGLNMMETISSEFERTQPLIHEPAKDEILKTLAMGKWPTSLTPALWLKK